MINVHLLNFCIQRLEHELQSQVAQIQQKLTETEAELTRAQDIIMSQRLQIEEMVSVPYTAKKPDNLPQLQASKQFTSAIVKHCSYGMLPLFAAYI